jgi:hypothetical protein
MRRDTQNDTFTNDKTVINAAKPFKRRFDSRLRHIKIILMKCQASMPPEEWRQLLEQTRICIINHPEDFLGDQLPSHEITKEAINQVFNGFAYDMHIRKVQSFRQTVQS